MFTDFSPDAPAKTAVPARPPGTAADWTVPQHWERFTAAEHRIWDFLFARQQQRLRGRCVAAFAEGLDLLRLLKPGIPDLDELNERLFARSGWTVVSVPGLVPDDVFYAHLAKRQFPAGNFIRPASQLDYLEEPDVFHDLFGHVPLLALPDFADFMQSLGQAGLEALQRGTLDRLARLYWYTVEFGLAREQGELKIYGAGLLSSFGEAHFSLVDPRPRRLPFALDRVLGTPYRPDAFQQVYFIVDGLDSLMDQLARSNLAQRLSAIKAVAK